MVRDCVSDEVPASRSSVHQGNVTEERALEKLTLKNVKTGGQSRKWKPKPSARNDVRPQAGRHTERGCWIDLVPRTPISTETGSRRFRLFCKTGQFNGTVTIERSSSQIQVGDESQFRSAHLLDLGEKSIEVLAFGAFVVGQPSLH